MKYKAITQLKADWKAENSDAREEGVQKWQLMEKVMEAKKRLNKDEENAEKLVVLAEAYGVIDPEDKRTMNVCERLMRVGMSELPLQRQGEGYQLIARCLFFADRFEETLQNLLRARACFHQQGNLKDRRINNTALLRAYAVLGRAKEAAERLEVALTLCREEDEAVMLYMHAKNALEHTGVARDAEVFDDIWFVYTDERPNVRHKFESYSQMCNNVAKQTMTNEEEDETFMARLKEAFHQTLADGSKEPVVRMMFVMLFLAVVSLCFLLSMSKAKGGGGFK